MYNDSDIALSNDQKMNVLVLFNDDHGQWALPAYGNSELHTPNIDYLAHTGVVFENAFTPIPVCSPARASFFTGLMPSQHNIHDFIAAADQYHQTDRLAGHNTLPQLLAAAGYECGFSGKWHIGQDEKVQPGFTDWFSLSGDYPIEHKGAYRYSDQGNIVTLSGYKTHYIADRTVQFLRQHNREKPFFHFSSFYATHSPWAGQPERLVDQYRKCSFSDIPSENKVFGADILNVEHSSPSDERNTEARAQYYGSVSAIDEAIGRILDELETLDSDRPTLIIFTSDHGLCLGHHGVWGKGNATAPQNLIEESIRIPMILSAKGVLPEGVRHTEFSDHLDLFQTILAAAGIEKPDIPYAGEDLIHLAQGSNNNWRQAQYCEYGPARMIRNGQYKYIHRYDGQSAELYDLSHADGEAENIIGSESHSHIVKGLSEELHRHFAKHDCLTVEELDFNGPARYNHIEAWRQPANRL